MLFYLSHTLPIQIFSEIGSELSSFTVLLLLIDIRKDFIIDKIWTR